jgi:hypothetical protein
VPGGEVGEIALDLGICIRELGFDHTLTCEGWALELLHKNAPISPGMKVTLVFAQHVCVQTELRLPYLPRSWDGETLLGHVQDPLSIVPNPVAFGMLLQPRKSKVQLRLDDVKVILPGRCGIVSFSCCTSLPSCRGSGGLLGLEGGWLR